MKTTIFTIGIIASFFVLTSHFACEDNPTPSTPQQPLPIEKVQSIELTQLTFPKTSADPFYQINATCMTPPPDTLLKEGIEYPQPSAKWKKGHTHFSYEKFTFDPPKPQQAISPIPGSSQVPSVGTDGGIHRRFHVADTVNQGYGPGGQSSPSVTQGSPSSPTLPKVAEADIIRIVNTRVYVLSQEHGLLIYSLTDPHNPVYLGQQKLEGSPVEMFVEQDKVYVLTNIPNRETTTTGIPHPYALLVSIDTQRVTSPRIVSSQILPGGLWQGSSRKRGNTFYIVSYKRRGQRTSYCTTRDISWNQQAFVSVIRANLTGKLNALQEFPLLAGPTDPARRTSFQGLTITLSDHALLVAEYRAGWERYRDCMQNDFQETIVNVFAQDGSKGTLIRTNRFSFEGFLTDQHKQTSFIHTKNKTAIYYALVQIRAKHGSDIANNKCTRPKLRVANHLLTIKLRPTEQPELLHMLPLGKPNEEIRGSLFALKHQRLYAITSETDSETARGAAAHLGGAPSGRFIGPPRPRTDPFYIIDLSNKEKPTILSEIDGLDGDINFFQTLQNHSFLVAVGRDSTGHCTGPRAKQEPDIVQTRVAVSLIDIRQPKNAQLVQRKCFGIKGLRSQFGGQDNLDQGHKQLALAAFGNKALLALPTTFQQQNNNQRASVISRMEVNLSPWKASKQQSLCTTCLITKPALAMNDVVLRVRFPEKQQEQTTTPAWTLGMNGRLFQIFDTQSTGILSNTFLAPPHHNMQQIYPVPGGYGQKQINTQQKSELVLQPNPKNGGWPSPFKITLEYADTITMWNTYFILTRFVSAPKNEQHLGQMKQQIQVVHLEKENKVRTSPFIDVAPGQTFHQTTPQQQSGHFGKLPLSGRRKRLLLSSGILAVSSLKSRTGLSLRSGVGFLDLREPMKPRFSTVPLPKGSQTIRLYQVDQQHVYVTFEMNTKTESRKYGREENIKVMAMSMSLSTDGWKTQPPIELPGALLAIKHTNESTYFITTDVSTTKTTDVASLGYKAWKQTQYDDPSYTLATRQIHLCQQLKNENKCSYINKLTFPHTDIENVRWNGDFLVLTGRRNWYWQRLNRSKLQKTNHVPIHLSYSLTADGLTLKK